MDAQTVESLAEKYEEGESDASGQPDSEQPKATQSEPDSNAGNLAVLLASGLGFAFKAIDGRVTLEDEEKEAAREPVGALLGKYDFGVGVDSIPNQEEIQGGFFIGALIKKGVLQLKALREADKKQREKENGKKRESEPEQPSHVVSGAEWPREKPSTQAQGTNTSEGREGNPLGHKQGSQSGTVSDTSAIFSDVD